MKIVIDKRPEGNQFSYKRCPFRLIYKNLKLSYRIIRHAFKHLLLTWIELNASEKCFLCGINQHVAISVDNETWDYVSENNKYNHLCMECYARLCYEKNCDMNIIKIFNWDGEFWLDKVWND